MSELCLSGITWNHSRALPPLVAASQRFAELHPGTKISWEARSLDEFGHADITALSSQYDLLIIDHPMMGDVRQSGALIDLQPLLPAGALAEMESDALGECLASYRYEDSLYALPIDAATPTASFRADLLERASVEAPSSWDQLLDLAQRGLVRMPGFPADLFLNFMGMCVSMGSPVADGDCLFEPRIASLCLEQLGVLASFMPRTIYAMNPIAIYEAMASGNEFAYCPFAYSYSNYARPGFAAHSLVFAHPVPLPDGTPQRTVLGGTGIAVSARNTHLKEAVEFCLFVSGRDCQRHLYGICQGQPARASAWRDPLLNRISNDFFERTLVTMQTAYVRPRYPGYIALQRAAGEPIAEYLRQEITLARALERLNALYRQSLAGATSSPVAQVAQVALP